MGAEKWPPRWDFDRRLSQCFWRILVSRDFLGSIDGVLDRGGQGIDTSSFGLAKDPLVCWESWVFVFWCHTSSHQLLAQCQSLHSVNSMAFISQAVEHGQRSSIDIDALLWIRQDSLRLHSHRCSMQWWYGCMPLVLLIICRVSLFTLIQFTSRLSFFSKTPRKRILITIWIRRRKSNWLPSRVDWQNVTLMERSRR